MTKKIKNLKTKRYVLLAIVFFVSIIALLLPHKEVPTPVLQESEPTQDVYDTLLYSLDSLNTRLQEY